MNNIPTKLRNELVVDPEYKFCTRYGWHDHECDGRITWEHTLIYAGKQLQIRSFIIALCEFGHSVGRHQDGGDLNKQINLWIALNRATDQEILSLSKAINYGRERERLNEKYGGPWHSKATNSVLQI